MAGTLLEKVLQSHKGIIIWTACEEEVAAEFPGLLPDFRVGFRSGLTVPLISGGEVIGGLALRSKGIGEIYRLGSETCGRDREPDCRSDYQCAALHGAEEGRKRTRTINKRLTRGSCQGEAIEWYAADCSSCKKIRDDRGYWNQIEVYVRDHSEAEFTHSVCPECMKKLYPDFCKDKGN